MSTRGHVAAVATVSVPLQGIVLTAWQHAQIIMPSLLQVYLSCRGHFGDVELAAPLLALSADADVAVASQAVGTLANMAVDLSAVKEQLLRHEGVARFAALAESMQPQLRLHGVWGLSSVAYMSAPEVKQAIAAQLPWSSVAALLEDEEPDVRVSAGTRMGGKGGDGLVGRRVGALTLLAG